MCGSRAAYVGLVCSRSSHRSSLWLEAPWQRIKGSVSVERVSFRSKRFLSFAPKTRKMSVCGARTDVGLVCSRPSHRSSSRLEAKWQGIKGSASVWLKRVHTVQNGPASKKGFPRNLVWVWLGNVTSLGLTTACGLSARG